MCTVTVEIDEKVLRGVNPNLNSPAAIRKWVQQLVDCHIQEMAAEEDETMDVEDLREMLHETVRKEYRLYG